MFVYSDVKKLRENRYLVKIFTGFFEKRGGALQKTEKKGNVRFNFLGSSCSPCSPMKVSPSASVFFRVILRCRSWSF